MRFSVQYTYRLFNFLEVNYNTLPVFTKLSIKQTPLHTGLLSLHRLHSIVHSDSFHDDLKYSSLNQLSEISWLSLSCLQYHSFILLDKHATICCYIGFHGFTSSCCPIVTRKDERQLPTKAIQLGN